jgi:primosomal protein N' (replication factor Y)
MKIVTVVPISRGISKDTLTYFTKNETPIGSIVSIPLRKKIIYGLVTDSQPADMMKSEIKSLSFSIKKIENIESLSFLSETFIKAVQKIADYNASSVGAVLSVLIPKIILENNKNLSLGEIKPKKDKNIFHETVLVQSDDEERYATYRSIIREEFAKNRSVFFCLPTTEDLLNAKGALEKGIEKYTFILHSGLSKKDLPAIWQGIVENKHPVLIICTGLFLSIPKEDVGTIILEKESSRAYKMQSRPYIDIRVAAEILAKEMKVRLVLGDNLLRTETLWEEKNGKYAELMPLKFRSLSSANSEIIDMKSPQDMKKKDFSVFNDKVKKLIRETKENNEHTFLFCARKGLYPITICSDCGTVVVCKNCNAPVVLYKNKNEEKNNLFVCHHCGERRSAQELCRKCSGWRLSPYGIGIERIREEVENILGKDRSQSLVIMDKEHITTHKQAVKAKEAFYNSPGSIMIGTELALPYLSQKIENAVVVSIDPYFSIPDYQINEKVFHILLNLRGITEKNFLIQTRREEIKLFDYSIKGNLVDFYRDEIEDRKAIGYPPFATYIKITIEGEKNAIKKQMQEIEKLFKPVVLNIYDAWNPGNKTKYTLHGLISLPRGKWIDAELLSKLRLLPPNISIKVDPVTLL